MQARMMNPIAVFPDVLQQLQAINKSGDEADLPYVTCKLVHLRASQINGCSQCVDYHSRELRQAGESDQRMFAVAAWREAPWFTGPERAALALTEAATRIADRGDAVPDPVWAEAARHYDERQLAALVIQIALINFFNRINATVRQVAGAWK